MKLNLTIEDRLYMKVLLAERGPLDKIRVSVEVEKTIELSDVEKLQIEYSETGGKATYKLNPEKEFHFSVQEICLLAEGCKSLDKQALIDRKNITLIEKILNILTYI